MERNATVHTTTVRLERIGSVGLVSSLRRVVLSASLLPILGSPPVVCRDGAGRRMFSVRHRNLILQCRLGRQAWSERNVVASGDISGEIERVTRQ